MVMNGTHPKLCIMKEYNPYSRGIFIGHNPLEYFIPLSMFQMALFFVVSQALYFLLRPLKQPKFVCNILAAVFLGPSLLGRYTSYMDKLFPEKEMITVNTFGVFSSMCFIFLTMVKMDTRILLSTAREAWCLGLFCTFIPLGITYGLFTLLQRRFMPGLPAGLSGLSGLATSTIMTATYLSDVANGLEELKLLTSELGQLAMSAATINDVLFVIMLVAMRMLLSLQKARAWQALLSALAFIIFTIYVVRPIIDWIIRRIPEGRPVSQSQIYSVLLGAFGMGMVSDALGLSLIPGVVAMGLIIPNGPPLGAAIVEKTELINTNIFLPFFFLRVGRFMDTKIQDWKAFKVMILIIASVYIVKFLATCLHSLFNHMKFRDVLLLSLMFNLKGVLSFVYFFAHHLNHHLDDQSFALLCLSTVAMHGIAVPLIEFFYKPRLRLETSFSANRHIMSLQLTPRIGELRILCCIHSEDDVHGIITLLEASNPTPMTTIYAYVVHLLELAGRATPLLAPYKKVGQGYSSTDRIMRAFTNYSQASNQSSVRVQPFTSIAPYKTMYQTTCRLAQEKHAPLILVPFHKNQIGEINANLSCFNSHMQAYSTSTVGILVQRGLSCVSCADFFINIAVVFVGGADDREALALAIRMSGHPRVKITVTRIILKGENMHEDGLEEHLDNQMLNEFEAETKTNVSVQYLEVILNDGIEVVGWLKSLKEKNYDLIMVGKRKGSESDLKLEEYMEYWVENPQLGVIGDMLASDDFSGGTVSVLVLQHCMVGEALDKSNFNTFGR